MRKAWHQRDPIKISQADFDRLSFREDVEDEDYEDEGYYRARAYPEDLFVWVAYDDDAETAGEWHMAHAEVI